MVGPGVLSFGTFGDVFSDETDIRPTILTLIGLKDDYAHDGRVLFEALSPNALPVSLRTDATLLALLAQTYKAITAPVGELGVRTLTGIATRAAEADSATYAVLDAQIKALTARRDAVAGKMIAMLEDAAFAGRPIDRAAAVVLIREADDLLGVGP
jgi:hypothetical protein